MGGEPVSKPRGLRLGDEPPLAEAKLAPPRARWGMVHRTRISSALDRAAETPFTLVAAPAGYGKTTAVRAWCAHGDMALAWVTLDAGDNDPVRMWTYIATAVDRLRRGSGRVVLELLSVAGGPIASPITELFNGVADSGRETVLVLDDLHLVTDRDCLASIDFAIANLPACMHIIALARADPALTLGRLRAAGDLVELRADELAFTASEAHELLVEHGHLDLDAAEVELLRSRTEGWPAALVLAGIWLRSHADPHRAVRTFGGEQHFVAEYLSQEALGSLAEHERSFLLRACVLRHFTAAMCDDVFGRADSAAMLADLGRFQSADRASRSRRVVPGALAVRRVRALPAGGGRARSGEGDSPSRGRMAPRARPCRSKRSSMPPLQATTSWWRSCWLTITSRWSTPAVREPWSDGRRRCLTSMSSITQSSPSARRPRRR